MIGNAVSVSTTTGFVSIGQVNALSQLDVAGGIRALTGVPSTSQNVGYGFSSDGTSGMVRLDLDCRPTYKNLVHSFWTRAKHFNLWFLESPEFPSHRM